MKKYIYLYLICLIAHLPVDAQILLSDQDYINQTKYWFYRNRLINEFCQVGPNTGESLPLQSINYVSNGIDLGGKWMEAGDGSILKVSYYIGVLASEIKLLKMNGQSIDNSCRELYYALNALKRLDETAETYSFCNTLIPNYNTDGTQRVPALYPNPNPQPCQGTSTSGQWNGFLIRGDIDPRNGINDNDPVNNSYKSSNFLYFNNITGGVNDGISRIRTDFGANIIGFEKEKDGDLTNGTDNAYIETDNDMSHDQLNHALLAARMVQVFLDGSETYDPPPGGSPVNLKDFTKTIATKIVDYMANGSITTADDNNCAYLKNYLSDPSKKHPLLEWSFLDMNPLSDGVCTNQEIVLSGWVPWLFQNPVINLPSAIARSAGAAFPYTMTAGYGAIGNQIAGKNYVVMPLPLKMWKDMSGEVPKEVYKYSDNYKILSLVAATNSWDYPCGTVPCYQSICFLRNPFNGNCIKGKSFPLPGTICGYLTVCKTGRESFQEQCAKAHFEWLPLLNNVLYGTTEFYTKYMDFEGFYQQMINNAPCRGPWANSTSNSEKDNNGWAGWCLLVNSQKSDYNIRFTGTDPSAFPWDPGEYNGLDYMLIYNLYNIYKGNPHPYYVNYDNSLNLSNRIISGKQEYYNARAYKDYVDVANGHTGAWINGTITAGNSFTITNNGYANFRAGTSINLQPGFSVDAGSGFEGTIYQPANNANWEMNICGSGSFNNGVPDGHKIAAPQQQAIMLDELQTLSGDALGNAYPNPASDLVTIPYSIGEAGFAEIEVMDMFGRTITTLVSKEKHETGRFYIDYSTSILSPGVYYYSLKTMKGSQTKKMMIIK